VGSESPSIPERFTLLQRDIEQELLPTVADLGVVVVAHSPTGHGLLHHPPSTADDQGASGLRAALGEIASRHDTTSGQIALAWVHHRQQAHGVPVIPISGTTSVRHLRSNVAAADLSLSDDDLGRLDTLRAAS
jgi:aryl-alcohol dehydrogenase-like predicted oxidoreductase